MDTAELVTDRHEVRRELPGRGDTVVVVFHYNSPRIPSAVYNKIVLRLLKS